MKQQLGQKIVFLFFFLALSVLIYQPFALFFLNDDMVHLPLSSQGVLFQLHSFRPIHDLLIVTEYRIWGIHAAGYHWVEWGIHILCSLGVYVIAKKIYYQFGNLPTNKISLAALITAAFFSVFAFHSESILWLLGSGASLCTLFFLLSVWAYLKRQNTYSFIISLMAFQLGLFTYEAIWMAPFTVFLLSWLSVKKEGNDWHKEWRFPLIYLLSFIANLLYRHHILGEWGGSYGDEQIFSIHIAKLAYQFFCLLIRSFAPPSASTIQFLIGAIVAGLLLLSGTIILWKQKKLDTLIALLSVSFLLSLLPVVSLGISTHSRESERFLYLPSVFVCMLLVYALFQMEWSKIALAFSLVLLLSYHALFTYLNTRDYIVAGNISKLFYSHFAKESVNKEHILIENLPQQLNGLPLFRVGFKEGIAWLYNTDTNRIKINTDKQLISTSKFARQFWIRNIDFSILSTPMPSGKKLRLQWDTTFYEEIPFEK